MYETVSSMRTILVVTHCAAYHRLCDLSTPPLDHVGIKQVLLFFIYTVKNNMTETGLLKHKAEYLN